MAGWSISDRRVPSAVERAELGARRDALFRSLAAAGQGEAYQLIAQLFLAFHGARVSAEEAGAQLALFAVQVAELPLWAIRAGCGELIRKDASWPPSAGQVRAACERACEADRDEYRRLNQIFSAQQVHEPDEAERARVTEAFEKLAKDIGLRDPYATEKLRRDAPSAPKETHDEALARLAREYAASPVGLTPEELKGRLA